MSRSRDIPRDGRFPGRRLRLSAGGITLVEMLIAMTLTLLLMGTVVSVFSMLGGSVANSRSTIEMADVLRGARELMQRDLVGATCPALPWTRPESNKGYIEYFEGTRTDGVPRLAGDAAIPAPRIVDDSALGDYDDILMLTVQSRDEPFVGRGPDGSDAGTEPDPVRSQFAEVVWYAVEDATTGLRTIYRRAFLIAPWIDLSGTSSDDAVYYGSTNQGLDISSRVVGGVRVANSLGDLTKRENRFGHNGGTFPHVLIAPYFAPLTDTREGEDVVLRNAVAFDVRAFDPGAGLCTGAGGTVLGPSDLGYPVAGAPVGFGAYVDLGYAYSPPANTPIPAFNYAGQAKSGLSLIYDTWSFHYENDGINQDGDALVDEGTDGFDSDNSLGVDDPAERETSPPYPVPLRALQARFRVYQQDSRQIREVSIVQNFVIE